LNSFSTTTMSSLEDLEFLVLITSIAFIQVVSGNKTIHKARLGLILPHDPQILTRCFFDT
jgi:hypothetical protein